MLSTGGGLGGKMKLSTVAEHLGRTTNIRYVEVSGSQTVVWVPLALLGLPLVIHKVI